MRKGFTLIEVLIVVIILGILATIALPQFTKVVKRARVAEAWTNIAAIRTGEAVYYLQYETYTTAVTNLDVVIGSPNFAYSVTGVSATNYNAVATGSGPVSGVTVWMTANGSNAVSGI